MPTFTASNSAVTAKASELIQSGLREIGVAAQGETVTPEDSTWCLEKLQRLIDRINAQREMIYNVNFTQYTLIANHHPHTIGPSGDFNTPLRPVRLESASLVLTSSTPNVSIPIQVRDDDWWAANNVKNLTSTLPTDVYYSPDTPLGNLNFWPIPTAVNGVMLETWVSITQAVSTSTSIALPAAYWDGIVMMLARDIAPSYGPDALAVVSSDAFKQTFKEAISAIKGNNTSSHRMTTDAPSNVRTGVRPGFNFLTGGSR